MNGSLLTPLVGPSTPTRVGTRSVSPWRILGWACFLACSWTWCIGMFLPALLARDYGPWSFAAFAVPNCLGAAAMGVLLVRRGASESIVRDHAAACRLFSYVTIAFQSFFLGWIATWFPLMLVVVCWIAALLLAGAARKFVGRNHRADTFLWMAAALFAGTVAVVVTWDRIGPAFPDLPWDAGVPADLLLLAPVCFFGFVLCPYLDLTFHRARQSLSGLAGSMAFTIGFGFLFLVPIVFTLAYSTLVADPGARESLVVRSFGPVSAMLGSYLVVQLFFTIAAHLRELDSASGIGIRLPGGTSAATLLAAILPFALGLISPRFPAYHDLTAPEIAYRAFMSAYGLLFPAYVWICVLPSRLSPPTRSTIAVWIGACALAAPAYWMGFIEREEWWLAPGLAAVLAARLLITRRPVGSGRAEPGPSLAPGFPRPDRLESDQAAR